MKCPHPQQSRFDLNTMPIRIDGQIKHVWNDLGSEAIASDSACQKCRGRDDGIGASQHTTAPLRMSSKELGHCAAPENHNQSTTQAFPDEGRCIFDNKAGATI